MSLSLLLLVFLGNAAFLAAGVALGWKFAAWRSRRLRRQWCRRDANALIRQLNREADAAGFLK